MPYPNTWVTIANPDALYDGVAPGVGMKVRKIHLAAFSSRANAESGTSPIPLVVWNLIRTSDQPPAEHYGPFSYGYYDAASAPGRWYAYRFESDTLDLGPWSEPWPAGPERPTLEQILSSLPAVLGDLFRATTAAGGTTTTIVLPVLGDPGYSTDYFLHWHLIVRTGGQYSFTRIASYSGTTATIAPALASAPASGAPVYMTPLLSGEQVIAAINLATDEMEGENEVDIPANEPVLCPEGLTRSSFLRAYAVRSADQREVPVRATFSGVPPRITVLTPSWAASARVAYLAPFSAIDGPLSLPSDVTSAPLPWVRAAAAAAIARMVMEQDPEDTMARALFERMATRAKEMAGKWAPERSVGAGRIQQRGPLPGPRTVR
jgi:hypothetical protein